MSTFTSNLHRYARRYAQKQAGTRKTFGGMANWNPHVHALINDTCWDREGNCYPMPEIDTTDIKGIEKLFAGLVFKMLLAEGMISEELVCEPDADYIPWQDDVPEIEVG